MEQFHVELPVIPKGVYNIADYGAVQGGTVSNTAIINEVIRQVAEFGGGTVLIPEGLWLSGPITLLSNIRLHLEKGAVLLFDKKEEEYPLYESDYEGMKAIRAKSPISARNASHIAITGSGVIDGNGQLWRPVKQFKVTEREWQELLKKSDYVVDTKEGGIWLPTKSAFEGFMMSYEKNGNLEDMETAQSHWDFYRPVLVRFYECDHILIEGVTLQNSPAWNVHPCFCEHITIRNATIRTPYYAQNGDGLDLESCKYAQILSTTFDVGDDAICMKSGKGEVARQREVPTEYVTIQDCIVYHGHGGFVVGSEMSRGVRQVEVKNCSFIGTDVGIRFKSALGRGGVVEDILLEDIHMHQIAKEAIIFTMGYVLDYREEESVKKQVKSGDIPYFRNITMKRISCDDAEIGLRAEGIDMDSLEVTDGGDKTPVIDRIVLEDSQIVARTPQMIRHAGTVILRGTKFMMQ